MTEKQCSVAGCGRSAKARGWCYAHWARWRKHGDPQAHIPVITRGTQQYPQCSVAGCEKDGIFKGMCELHRRRLRIYGDPTYVHDRVNVGKTCSVDGCEKPAHARTFCAAHYFHYRRNGGPPQEWHQARQPD